MSDQKIDLSELERKARAATPGAWTALDCASRDWHVGIPSGSGYISIARVSLGAQTGLEAAKVNAAANSAVILELIERVRKAEGALGEMVSGTINANWGKAPSITGKRP